MSCVRPSALVLAQVADAEETFSSRIEIFEGQTSRLPPLMVKLREEDRSKPPSFYDRVKETKEGHDGQCGRVPTRKRLTSSLPSIQASFRNWIFGDTVRPFLRVVGNRRHFKHAASAPRPTRSRSQPE